MVRRVRSPIIAIYAAILAVSCIPHLANSQGYSEGYRPSHLLDIAITNSDEYAESVLTIKPKTGTFGIGEQDHAKISSILSSTRELIDTAHHLIKHEETLKEGQSMMEQANAMFRDVKEIIRSRHQDYAAAGGGDQRDLLRKKYADHDIDQVHEDDERALEIARKMYETMVTFPECIGIIFADCLTIINAEIANLGLSTIEVVTHEKRNADQDGYNKVVIITNELADRVLGRTGDGIVSYPFMWKDVVSGERSLGVDGKWNCHDFTPEACCDSIKSSVPNKDERHKNIECHIYVPYGGVGNPRRNDRVFINLSPDGRVHEAPIIQ